jgi:1-phosphatidylinositol-3-phosphate 5-kinase
LHSDHIRFLCWRNVALRITVDPIEVSDVIVPPLRLRVDAWTQLRIKNEEYRAIQKSTAAYWESVIARIHNFNQDLLPPDRFENGQQALANYEDRARKDQQFFEGLLDKAYEDAPIGQPSALNSVRVALQAKVVSWETEFIK